MLLGEIAPTRRGDRPTDGVLIIPALGCSGGRANEGPLVGGPSERDGDGAPAALTYCLD